MAPRKTQKLNPGDTVYARWQGDDKFAVIRQIENQAVPHYLCRLSSLYAVEEYWVFPLLHLSQKSLVDLTKTSNRKQLSPFKTETDGNLSDTQGSTATSED